MANWSSASTSAWLGGLFFLALTLSLAKLALVVWGSPAAGSAGPAGSTAPAPQPAGPAAAAENNEASVEVDDGEVASDGVEAGEDAPSGPPGTPPDEEPLPVQANEAERWLAENNLGQHRELLQRLGESPSSSSSLPSGPKRAHLCFARRRRLGRRAGGKMAWKRPWRTISPAGKASLRQA